MNITGDAKLIATAFVKARKEMNSLVVKDAKGNYGKYVTLAAIVEATTEAFAANGLAIVQEASADEHGVCVETWLIHESGATMQFTPLPMPLTDRKPQAVGSAITYARRYALGAICGLAPDDDDGQAAQDSTRPQRPAQAPQRPQEARKPANQENVLLGQFDALGSELFADQWGKVSRRNVSRITNGATEDATQLTADQLQRLIAGMTEVKTKQPVPVAA